MEPIKKAWNYQLSENRKRSVKFKAGKAFLWFLAFMLSATLVSRSADSLTIATAKTENPRRSPITQTVETDGLLELSGGSPVKVPNGVYIKEVLVENGEQVTAGALLFTYDIQDYNKQIQGLELDIQKIAAQEATTKEENLAKREKDSTKRETDLQRKEDDLTTIEEDFDIRTRDLKQKVRAAEVALTKYDGVYRENYDGEEFTQSEHESLRSNYRSLLFQQEQLENEQANALQAVIRSIEDLSTEEADTENNPRLQELEKQKLRLELNSLYKAVQSGGAAYAPSDGIVTDMKVTAGSNSSGEAALFLTQKGGLVGKATLTKEQKKFIQVGDTLTFTPYGEREGHKGLIVKKLEPDKDDPSLYDMTVDVEGLELPAGTGGALSYLKKSNTYETCVPLSALYSEGNNVYVLVIDETETPLGAEKVARRVDVIVQEKNEKSAAVSGALSSNDQVITSTNKPLEHGSRIRLEAIT